MRRIRKCRLRADTCFVYVGDPGRRQKRGANIICEYMGGATNCDAHHMTDPRADGKGVAGCIKMALKNADLDPEAIDYINPHATR